MRKEVDYFCGFSDWLLGGGGGGVGEGEWSTTTSSSPLMFQLLLRVLFILPRAFVRRLDSNEEK